MEIRISDLKLKNFKGIKNLEINFDCKNTNIYGANATGKTTIFDAFKWLFFDKDSSDRKDFNIKTLDKENKPIHYLEHEVEATLVIDGIDMIFRKMFKEKWVKKRGQAEQEFAGHETSYWIDEVPIKKKDYEEKINSIIPESLFKLITDPSFFNNQMKWQERRELLTNISGESITDEDILNANEEFESLKQKLEGRSIEDYKKVVQEKIKNLNKQKEAIPIRIDELTNTLITEHNIDYNKLEKEKEECNTYLQQIESEMTDVQARAQENIKKADMLAVAKNELHNLQFKLEVEHSKKYTTDAVNLNNEKTLLESKIRNKKQEYEERNLKIDQDQKRKQELYKKWDEVCNAKLEIVPNSLICPTCKREYNAEKQDEIIKQLEDNFNAHKKSEQDAINSEGKTINERIQENTAAKDMLENEIQGLENELNKVAIKLTDIEKQQEESKEFDVTSLPEYKEKLKQVDELEEIVGKLAKEDTTELQNKKASLVEKINSIDKQLNEKLIQEKTKSRIEELEKEEEELSIAIQELEGQQYQIEQFTKAKVELLEKSINDKFQVVKFRLFDVQINGGLVECCDTLVNGVPYADVNNAHKILAGLDIINTLIKFYDTSAPIFIDNRESINELYDINTQIISLIVTTDTTLRIEAM